MLHAPFRLPDPLLSALLASAAACAAACSAGPEGTASGGSSGKAGAAGTGATTSMGGTAGAAGSTGGSGGMAGSAMTGSGGVAGSAMTGSGGMAGSGGSGSCVGGGGSGGAPPECAPACSAVSGIPSDCIAITDNSAQSLYGLRMGQLNLAKPAALTSPIIVSLMDQATTMNLGACNLSGSGTLSWLIELDPAAGKLRTGGAKEQPDPTAGYCFINQVMSGFPVFPATMSATLDACGHLDVPSGVDMVLPLFVTPGAPDAILLPISKARFLSTTISADHNCIGRYNADKLKAIDSCEPSGGVTRFQNGGTVDGFITLEAADAVVVAPLAETLCALLTGENDGGAPVKKCKRNATNQITSQGDWCAPMDAAASPGCADAYKLTGDFAASAVKITGNCN